VLLDRGELERAEEALRAAAEAEFPLAGRHRAMVHANLATVLEGLDRRPEAREELEKAVRFDPRNLDLRERLSEFEIEPPAVPRRTR
jgi:tetratricopeptide (TPR) repeat protein